MDQIRKESDADGSPLDLNGRGRAHQFPRGTDSPDHSLPEQRVAFGTSGQRGSAFDKAFNE